MLQSTRNLQLIGEDGLSVERWDTNFKIQEEHPPLPLEISVIFCFFKIKKQSNLRFLLNVQKQKVFWLKGDLHKKIIASLCPNP